MKKEPIPRIFGAYGVWTPVSDALPKSCQTVLVSFRDHGGDLRVYKRGLQWNGQAWRAEHEDLIYTGDVTHWMRWPCSPTGNE